MKHYVCDICGSVIDNPHTERMREFCFSVSNSDIYQIPMPFEKKVKIHLCGDCFEEFKFVAKQKKIKERSGK